MLRWLSMCFVLALLLGSMLLGSSGKKDEPEGYRVLSHDAQTHQWIILRTGTFDGKYLRKRLTVVCSFYQWGKREPARGPDACDLKVGRMMIPNPLPPPENRKEFLDIWEMDAETLSITEGNGDDRVTQQFRILKYEVLPDDAA